MNADERDLLYNLEERVKVLERDLTRTAEHLAEVTKDFALSTLLTAFHTGAQASGDATKGDEE